MKFTCYPNKILVKPLTEKTIIQSNSNEMTPEKGEVMDVGTGVFFVKKGDIVHFLAYGCSTAKGQEGEEYYILTDDEAIILGKESDE